MRIGKLDNETLEQLILSHYRHYRPEVKTGPGIGEDCAVLDFGEYNCVLSTDPITGAVRDIGRLAVTVSCNDIASNGTEPLGLLLTMMLPPETTEAQMEQIAADAAAEADRIGVEIIGGHTEITPAVRVPIVSVTAVGRQIAASAVERAAEPGDILIVTKALGLEGTGILASDRRELLSEFLTEEELEEALSCLQETSVVKEGVLAGRAGAGPMHDITEGGLLGAVWELCRIAGTGASIDMDLVPVRPVTKKICQHLQLNPYRLISSGSMLIVVRPHRLPELQQKFEDAEIDYTIIGTMTERSEGMPIDPPSADELFRIIHRETK